MLKSKVLQMTAISALMASGLLATSAYAAPKIGQPAPDFSVIDSNGDLRTLDEFEGKRVVLEWTNSGCPYVKKHYDSSFENMQGLQADLTEGDETVWLSIISSAPGKQGYKTGEEANAHATSVGASPAAILMDPEGTMGKAYAAKTTPHMYIIDSDADQTMLYMGAIDSNNSSNPADIETADNYVVLASDKIDAGEAVDPAVTKAYGCSIKYAS